MTQPLRILFLAAEAEPFVKVGGLGDVAGSLPHALRTLSLPDGLAGVDIRLVLPYYGAIDRQKLSLIKIATFTIPYDSTQINADVLSYSDEGLPVYFVKSDFIPLDGPIYSSEMTAEGRKFIFFSLAALELVRNLEWAPQIIHANDWHTAPAVYALSSRRKLEKFFFNTSTLLGLHNLPYMGNGTGEVLRRFGLEPAEESSLPAWAHDVPLALGLLTADHIVAVSPSYAQEILTKEFGSGLQNLLRKRREKITGILNGLDTRRWNPESDHAIVQRYSSQIIDRRRMNKQALQQELLLPQDHRIPLFGVVSRLDHQKGIDLIPEAFRLITHSGSLHQFQAVILGTGDAQIESEMHNLEYSFPKMVKFVNRYDADLSRRIYSGADILLIPSRYEPCGLTQMIAMRYGCIPVGRQTGGLKDTIQDYAASENSSGFLFHRPTSYSLARAMQRAMSLFLKYPKDWLQLQQRCINRDYSWINSARQYYQLYLKIIADLH